MQSIYLNGEEFETMKEVHEFLSDNLDFPGYYGRNLSALYDVLTDICEDTRIVADLTRVEDEKMMDGLVRMVEVMEDAAAENGYLEVEVIGG